MNLRLLGTLIGILALASGCRPSGQPANPGPAPAAKNDGAATGLDATLAELVGTLRFLNNEYQAAVKDGQIVDEIEYREASMAAGQAKRLWEQAGAGLEKKDAAAAKSSAEWIAAVRQKVKDKAAPAEVARLVAELTRTLEAHIEGGVSPNVRGTAAAVRAADADIRGELVVSEYRLGLATFAPRPLGFYDAKGGWCEVARSQEFTHLLGVVVREKGTKRALPSAKVTARWGNTTAPLAPIWGDYLFYGANVALPEGSFTLAVDVEPPQICRHGDALAAYLEPAHAEFKVTRQGAEVTVEAGKPGPGNADYRVGEDVEQALAESLFVREEGEYRIGFIAEGPEPIWVWEGGKLESRPATDADTHHLEIALLERGTNRIVMGAEVSLEMKDKATGEVRKVPMHNLLSSFAHYGVTLKVPEAVYEITATVRPPQWLQFEAGRYAKPVAITFEWDGKPKQE